MMSDQCLIERGYKRYPPAAIDPEMVVARFQKRFDDERGKKYFIDVKKNSQDFVPEHQRGSWWRPFVYTYEVQITMGEDEKCINLNFFHDWTVENVEEFMENFFEKMQPNYYETWDGERHTR